MFKLLSLLIGLVLFSVLGYTYINKKVAPAIQKDIKGRAISSLHAVNMDSITVNADGRDLTLRGSVGSEKQRIAAERAADVKWVTSIENQLIISSISPDYYFDAQKDEAKKISLKGYVANTNSHHDLVSYVMASHNKPTITDALQERTNAPEKWTDIVRAGVDSLKLLESGQLIIRNKHLSLSGKTVVARNYIRIDEILSNSLPAGYEKSLDINFVPQDDTKAEKRLDSKAGSKASNKECRSQLNATISHSNIRFRTGSSVITSSSSKQLKKIATMKARCPTLVLNIKGHTDSQGNDRLNWLLSQKRAIAVKNHLMNSDLASNTITAEGFGETLPIADNKTRIGRKKNRRIEITIEDFLPAKGSLPAEGSL